MDRVRSENYIESESKRLFTDGPPATTVDAEWLNSVQEEIMNVITAAGIAPSFTDLTQLLQAIQHIIQINSHYASDTGSVNALSASITGINEYSDGLFLLIKAKYSNTDACTLDLNGLGAKDILQDDGGMLVNGDIKINTIAVLVYQSTGDYFQLINPINKTSTSAGYMQQNGGTAIDKFVFSTETYAAITAVVAAARAANGGIHSIKTKKGYWGGGSNGGAEQDDVFGLDMRNETSLSPAMLLSLGRWSLGGINNNSGSHGYWLGGYKPVPATFFDDIDGMIFASETLNDPAATLSILRATAASLSAIVENKGYYGGGINAGGAKNSIDGFEFTSETAAAIAAVLADGARSDLTGVNSYIRGYFCGGSAPSSAVDGIKFSDETAVNPAMTLAVARSPVGINNDSNGYCISGTPSTAEIDGIKFSDETLINPAATSTHDHTYIGTFQSGGSL